MGEGIAGTFSVKADNEVQWIFEVRHLQSSQGFEPLHSTHSADAAVLLKVVANLILVELLMEICTKLERELHKKVEVLGSLTLS